MTNGNSYFKHGLFLLSYLLLLAVESYFIRSVKVLYSPYLFLGSLVVLGLGLNFIFLFLFGKQEKALLPFLLYQVIQASLAFLISCFLFHLSWETSLAYPAGALIAFVSFVLIRVESALKNIFLALFLAGGLALALRLSAVNGALLFAFALLNGFYLGGKLLSSHSLAEKSWEGAVFFTTTLALGRAAIQYYLIESNYDSLGVVITHPYTFVALFAGIFLPIVYTLILKDRLLNSILTFILLGILFPWIFGVFIHVRPFAGYLLGFVVSSFVVGILFSAPFTLTLLSYCNLASGVIGVTLFSMLANLSRGLRLGILAGVFALSLLGYFLQTLLQKNKI